MLPRPATYSRPLRNSIPKMFPTVYPDITQLVQPDRTAKGSFPGGRPAGIVIHYTADPNTIRVIKHLHENKLGYHLLIRRDGKIIQMCFLNRYCYHAGKAEWNGLKCNKNFMSVAIASWGKLGSDRRAWNGTVVSSNHIAYRPDLQGKPQYWHAATSAQQKALGQIIEWSISNGIRPRNICGHDECALPLGRKVDPGGVLTYSVKTIRRRLKSQFGGIDKND